MLSTPRGPIDADFSMLGLGETELTAQKNRVRWFAIISKAGRMPNSKRPIAESKSIVTSETFRFFRDLSRNNRTEWMDSNRDRYKQCVVQPLRELCEELSPAILKLDPQFETSGRTGANLSRINRDIPFAKDKTPYRTGMYVKFSAPFDAERETGQRHLSSSAKQGTSGFPR